MPSLKPKSRTVDKMEKQNQIITDFSQSPVCSTLQVASQLSSRHLSRTTEHILPEGKEVDYFVDLKVKGRRKKASAGNEEKLYEITTPS
ncbi:14244_t:CDS:2 [Acaulospora morrowiae]|uniref:14244_t:CDS:1 n=1 Tax=Acaulospora morrowiae TaxID=94023 RepID=A0A9N8WKY3_9GLOM|nr:14244_t:CDS:2 [Acaulospora morrowiae]